ncbi:S8 family serine peptidase [Thalassotalea ponticola]|uniref:S8 family serine peptidase n=1 Tax=Thalassotalea ponticola TaxID=1523392 RepID=UPI0025B386D6|nr:S8 family serine peptidase [Thalassotalea ponticola]MDN3653360.1 S8 family serine peptidase [Thalassotalea ponticola]
MFNLTKVSVVIASALYAGAVGAIAADAPQSGWHQAPADYKAPQPIERADYPGIANQQIKTQHKVFTPEENISGVHTYIVQLTDEPVATYHGGIDGMPATVSHISRARQNQHQPLDLAQPEIASYRQYLTNKRQQVMNQASQLQGVHIQAKQTFSVTLNAFTTDLTQQQAMRLAKVPGVKRITRSKVYDLQTSNTIEQTGAHAVWQDPVRGENMGEGIVVGIIDTGINTDHPSFAAIGGDGYAHTNPLGEGNFLGDCVDSPSLCNDKLIGVYSYPEITAAYSDPVFEESRPAIGEDYNSHGSHVAGTAAGNVLYDVPFKLIEGTPQGSGKDTNLIFPQVSGMAPHANIVSYQVCWPGGRGDPYAGCPSTALLAAIEQAAIDNVDVINFSIGGLEQNPWEDPIEQAFANTAQSGVFIAAAAGNSGDRLSTADHSSPWLTTVAAHTPAKTVEFTDKTLTNLSGGDTPAPVEINGVSVTFDEITGLIVNAADYPNPNENYSWNMANCDKPYPEGTFDLEDDPATLDIDESQQDVIVVCKRSSNPLYFKASNVGAGGAEGLIIYNYSSWQDRSPIPAVAHPLPTIHITNADGKKVVDWLASGAGHMGTITATQAYEQDVEDEFIAGFSGRGPSYFGLDTLFVDIAAPGVDIYAPSSDDQPFTNNPRTSNWQTMSGTSMASPHVAGAAALLRQSHPDWSPMEVQSALLLTASNTLKNATILNNYSDSGWNSALQDMGAGRMNVDLADKAGLVMDESIANMQAANPNLGGHEKRLNTAYMVDTECVDECSFVRSFKATKDGSYTVSSEIFFGEFDIEVEPLAFDIKAGETQNIVVTAKQRHSAGANNYIDMTGNQGQVILTPRDPDSPVLELPVWTYDGDSGLPEHVMIKAHRTSATTAIGPFNTREVNDFTARSFGLVKGQTQSAHLYYDQTSGDPFDLTPVEPGSEQLENVNHVVMTQVIEGSKMLSSRVVGDNVTNALLFMGQDLNNDGLASYDEMLCMSTNYDDANFCSVIDPNPGTYWTLVMNTDRPGWNEEDMGREVSVTTAVVDADQQNLTVSAPKQIPGYDEYMVELAYQLPEMEIGDVYFGGFDIGSDGNNAGNIGFVPVTISQVDEDVTFTANKHATKPGEMVDFNIKVIANTEAQARDFTLQTVFPDSIQIIPDSVHASKATPAAPEFSNNTLALSGIQESTRDVVRNYKITTNATDEMCSLQAARSPYPGYLDLRELGWRTLENVQGRYYNEYEYALKDLMNWDQEISFPFFNKYHFSSLKINPAGLVTFGSQGRTTPFHVEFPRAASYPPPPPYMIAPFWVGDNTIAERYNSTYPNHHLNAGVTPTYTYDREWLVLEWDNVERAYKSGQMVDFEMFMRMNINFEPGEYEMLFAYDNVQLADGQGSIGFKASDGMMLIDGDMPMAINIGDSVAYNNLDEVVTDELVVCMDYTGPEESQFNVSFQAYVSEAAAGQSHTLVVNNGLVGSENEQLSLTLDVTGNIQLADLGDITITEGEQASFKVLYADENTTNNVIEVTADNISAVVDGNDSGSQVILTPDTGYYGATEVVVKVYDSVNPSDFASGSFMLYVESDGIELGCTDSSATNFDENANTDDGSCEYPATEISGKSPDSDSSGGSQSIFALMALLIMTTLRRRIR